MITLAAIFIIWFIISYVRITKICQQKGVSFNPLEATIIDWFGFALGITTLFVMFIVLITYFLP